MYNCRICQYLHRYGYIQCKQCRHEVQCVVSGSIYMYTYTHTYVGIYSYKHEYLPIQNVQLAFITHKMKPHNYLRVFTTANNVSHLYNTHPLIVLKFCCKLQPNLNTSTAHAQ